MNIKKLKKLLTKYGWLFKREGGRHEIWSNGEMTQAIPRHREISEYTAKKIISIAKNNPR